MYVVIAQEIHRDRLIHETYGPFEDEGEALEYADKMDRDPSNFYGGYQKAIHQVFLMEKP